VQHVGHLVRVVLVHLAAERADEKLFRHGLDCTARLRGGRLTRGSRAGEKAQIMQTGPVGTRYLPRPPGAGYNWFQQVSAAGSFLGGETGMRCRAWLALPILRAKAALPPQR
jgi:hypothetical protein